MKLTLKGRKEYRNESEMTADLKISEAAIFSGKSNLNG